MPHTDPSEIMTFRFARPATEASGDLRALDVFLATCAETNDDTTEENVADFSLSGLARCRTIAEPRRAEALSNFPGSLNIQAAALLRMLQSASHASEDIPVTRWRDLPGPDLASAAPAANCVLITEIDFDDWSESIAARLSGAMALARHRLGLLASPRAAKLIAARLADALPRG